jgi:DNA repair exonuclease SbcCD ATPase subunit
MRLDAQILMTEKKARPLWLTITPIVLVIGLAGLSYYAWTTIEERDAVAAAERAKAEKRDQDNQKALETLMAELNELKTEQERLEKERAALDAKLGQVQDETERQRLLAEKAALEQQLDDNKAKQSKNKTKRPKAPKEETKKKPAITVTKTDDPLDGL